MTNKLRFVVLLCLLSVIAFLAGGLIASAKSKNTRLQSIQNPSKIAPWVVEKTAAGEMAEFLVVLADQADLSRAGQLKTKEEKGRFVFEALRDKARSTQGRLLDWLKERNVEHRSFFIVNAILVRGAGDVARELAARPDVMRIEGNPQLPGIQPLNPIGTDESDVLRLGAVTQSAETGVEYIRAPEVWGMGVTGQGIVIGGQDTGVRWDHPALKAQYKGWDGSRVNHDYNWHDSVHSGGGVCGPDSKVPCDDDNHGTHTIGTSVGSDGVVNQIGVAPGARFIACRNMDRGMGTPATYLECFQFFLAPFPVNGAPDEGDPSKAPDITTNSWSCPPSEGCSPDTLRAAVEAQRAAGIMTVVAAGNAGASCSTVIDPPAVYDSSYSVGAFNAFTGEIASFSSRGPVLIDGSNRIKPDITAPGVAVRSALKNGGYGAFNGTSMATPHVAGAVALLWSAYPELRGQIQLTENILNESAVRVEAGNCGGAGFPNNVFGFGRLDVKAAYDLAATTLSASELAFEARGGEGGIEVTTVPTATWRAVSETRWIAITSGKNGEAENTGSGSVIFNVEANTSAYQRTGTLVIAGRTVRITQAAALPAFAVSGRVKNEESAPLGRVTLTFTVVSGTGRTPDPVISDFEGKWSQTGFEHGTTYRVTASRSRMNFSPQSRDFAAADSSLDFMSIGRRIAIGIAQ